MAKGPLMNASPILLDKTGIEGTLPKGKADPGLILSEPAADVAAAFIDAIAKHRHMERDCEPPLV
jgi:catalase